MNQAVCNLHVLETQFLNSMELARHALHSLPQEALSVKVTHKWFHKNHRFQSASATSVKVKRFSKQMDHVLTAHQEHIQILPMVNHVSQKLLAATTGDK